MRFSLASTAVAFITTALACQTKSATAASGTYCPPSEVSPQQQMAIFKDFIQAFYVERDVNKTAAHVDVNYIQHNADVLSGRQAFFNALSATAGGNTTTTIVHMALQDNIAWVHYKSVTPGSPLTAVVDVFRFNGGCIMEHWDAIEPLPANATNPLALF